MDTGAAVDTGGEARVANEAEQRLRDSALRLFAQKGYDGTSIREIIEDAGVTRPVLYYYFKNKEDLFTRLIEGLFAKVVADVEAAGRSVEGCRSRLKAITQATFAWTEDAPERVRLLLQVLFAPPEAGPRLDQMGLVEARFDLIVEVMREGLESGELRGDDPEALALAFCGVMDMHVMARLHRPGAHLTAELGSGLVDLFFDGAASRAT